MKKDRLVVFGNPQSYITWILLSYLVRQAWQYRSGIQIAQLILNTPGKKRVPELKGNVALSIAYPHRIDISPFDYAVNYHNSLLPHYAGVYSTAWAIYLGETSTGFTWHRMTQNFDDGNILWQGSLKVDFEPSGWLSMSKYEMRKTTLAGRELGLVLDSILDRSEGIPQSGARSYFGLGDYQDMVGDTYISEAEAIRRASIFGQSAGPHKRNIIESLLGKIA